MPSYDGERFAPPAPVAKVCVRNPETSASIDDVEMLIDSGADATLLPRHLVQALALTPGAEKYELLSFDDTPSEAEAVRARIVLLARNFTGLFLVVDAGIGVIARNILNNLRIVLDGPAGEWGEEPPAGHNLA